MPVLPITQGIMVIIIRDQVGMAATMVDIMEIIMMDIITTGIITGIVVIGISAIDTMGVVIGATRIAEIGIMGEVAKTMTGIE